ncbi:helix-turn-helix transcriptional regulator [Niallia taxi]|uniref:winged helix-turn-helix transcriptional regulator n=1 Tax=Niallia taxi TaxID=2499688 RepID=UPI002040A6B3|nr:helix-turn-helix domain-containing protein [Niallia taxi]MCM3216664.1 helix-turn-helix transcriptional regulator [Niallia taxi]
MKEQYQLGPKLIKSFDILGKRWNGLIIYVLLNGPMRFGEIYKIIPDLSNRMLTERLKELEKQGIVSRNVVSGSTVRLEYQLTIKGYELGGILGLVSQWSEKWLNE